MGMTITEKILAQASGKRSVTPGETLTINPDVVVINDYYLYPWFIDMMSEMGIEKVFDPNKLVIGIDHRVPADNIEFAEKHKHIREFAKKQAIKHFYDVGRSGINHQGMGERGFARPGTVYADHDAQATTLGAFGCFAASYGLGIIQAIVSGELWCIVPESIKIKVVGNFPIGVGSRDLIHFIIGKLGLNGALYKAVEFVGPTIDSMSIDSRMVMCNIIVHCEAKVGIMNPDEKTIKYVKSRTKEPFNILTSDSDATYERELDFDVSNLEPMVAAPHEPVNVKKIRDVEGIRVHQAFIGSCASGRIEDLEIAARILRGRKIHPDVRMIIIPSSKEIFLEMIKRGLMEIFVQSDVIIDTPNCGPCAGAHMGTLGSGEVCIASSTTNIRGRMGSEDSEIYLASPAAVAASALEGKITDPREFLT